MFLISRSPEQLGVYAADNLKGRACRIAQCSIQYAESVRQVRGCAAEAGMVRFVLWLNPGRHDAGETYDRLGLMPWRLGHDATASMGDGKLPSAPWTEDIRQFIHGWAKGHGLAFARP